jgi:hypothetical protein
MINGIHLLNVGSMSKITKQELYTMVRNLENWMSDIKIDVFNQPNVTLPKSTRDDVEVGSRLDSLEARMDMVEGMFKTEPDIKPEPQKERKIVFDWHVHAERGIEKPLTRPQEYKTIEEIFKIGENSYLFKASFGQIYNTLTYIGHYE